ncbi:hypothetical protein HUA76_09855 [Myxococcus sp. CA056]|uniref:hypothetical protein n=1 Tax=unclassified Myxococcus TaxID=2648731 RepID=UPI00157B1193|nr:MULTISPECIES: hypothetical protein [unclassified Myxococcus]NTX11090.1 hypothetical protein [Myxococcus sp. CA056]NTX34820.1 hypothetical protein [Myxococcus sp. CA033]
MSLCLSLSWCRLASTALPLSAFPPRDARLLSLAPPARSVGDAAAAWTWAVVGGRAE